MTKDMGIVSIEDSVWIEREVGKEGSVLMGSAVEAEKDEEQEEDLELSEDFVKEFQAWSIEHKKKLVEKYPAKLHARSVAKRLGVKDGLIYLPGSTSPDYPDSDMGPPLRQLRYFYYLSGINAANVIVTYDIAEDNLVVWLPPIPAPRMVLYNGPIPTAEEIHAQSEVDRVERTTKLDAYLTFYSHFKTGKIYLLHENQAPKITLAIRMKNGKKSVINAPPYETGKLQPAMNDARGVKSDYEVKMLRKANLISARAHTNVLHGITRFKNEAEIEAVFLATSVAYQAKMQSYGIIAGSGHNASTLHYMANDEPLKGRQLVCLDAGAEWKCYSSDVTRTFPISGTWTKEAKAIYDLVEAMQEACIAIIKPGLNWAREGTLLSHSMAVKGLMKLGLLRGGTYEEIYKSGASSAFFPHGLGHFMGLEVHDVGEAVFPAGPAYSLYGFRTPPQDWTDAFLQLLKPGITSNRFLEPNMVLTVEPGIYFNRYAMEEVYLKDERFAKYINKPLLEKYYDVGGVRIEDDILVTEGGYENLTTAPKGDRALEIINEWKRKMVGEGSELW